MKKLTSSAVSEQCRGFHSKHNCSTHRVVSISGPDLNHLRINLGVPVHSHRIRSSFEPRNVDVAGYRYRHASVLLTVQRRRAFVASLDG